MPRPEKKRARLRRLSEHFVCRWTERVGTSVDIHKIRHVLAGALCIQPQIHAFGRHVTRGQVCFKHKKINAVFWHPGHGLILIVDESTKTAVTVFSYRDWQMTKGQDS